ncbi:MAG: hypothetical protein ACE148_07030 [Vicinamibacterales bacterium]
MTKHNSPEVVCAAEEDALDVAKRASDFLEAAGREREAFELRERVLAALDRRYGKEKVLGIVGEYVALLSRQ